MQYLLLSSKSENVCFLILDAHRFFIRQRGGEIDRSRISLNLMWLGLIMGGRNLAFGGFIFDRRFVFCKRGGPSIESIRNWLIRVYQ